tara:strand:- start:3455 stop:3931 length:477 start_codon:yes stop_codon:yes gene_type:complete
MTKLPPESSVGFQVRRCHLKFDRLITSKLADHRLKAGYWYYLRALWIQDGITQKELSEVANVTETTMVSVINGMIADGLVTRSRDEVDKRKFRVNLTDYGRGLEQELMESIAIDTLRIATAGLTPEEVETCCRLLAKMSDNLDVELHDLPAGRSGKRR